METTRINEVQREIYDDEETKRLKTYFKVYDNAIKKMKEKMEITILDIGGGGGYFARYVDQQLRAVDSKCARIKIVVIDTVKYDTWTSWEDGIEYVLCDAVNIGSTFEKETFDFIFCNMFVHHLIGKSYNDSASIRKRVFEGINKVLKKDGKLLIIDNFNDGFLFDSVSCRLVYGMTTCRNPILKTIFFRLGAHSAGSGVCMMSEKMWEDLLNHTGFKITQKRCPRSDEWMMIKRIVLLNKEYRQECYLMAEKS